MKPEWILIANATRARLLQRELGCPLVVIDATEEEYLGVGELKAELGTATARLVSATHDLDLTSVGLVELDQRVAQESTLQAGRP